MLPEQVLENEVGNVLKAPQSKPRGVRLQPRSVSLSGKKAVDFAAL
jgi:hypothetical protein